MKPLNKQCLLNLYSITERKEKVLLLMFPEAIESKREKIY